MRWKKSVSAFAAGIIVIFSIQPIISLNPEGVSAKAPHGLQDEIELLADSGDLDLSFGGFSDRKPGSLAGQVLTDVGAGDDVASAIAMQSDGKIVIGGYSGPVNNRNFALVRYNPDGTLDRTFNADGKVTTDFSRREDSIAALAIQSDGKIIAVGFATTAAGNDIALARYLPDGRLDRTFGGDGKVTTDLDQNESANAVALQADGKIIVAGQSSAIACPTGFCPNYDFVLIRYTASGGLDATFDPDADPRNGSGIARTDFGDFEFCNAVAVQADGKIVAAGYRSNRCDGCTNDFALARYDSSGRLDPTFDGDGKLLTNFGAEDVAQSLQLLPDGKILAIGFTNSAGSYDFALARYNPDGRLDQTFDSDGKLISKLEGDEYGYASVLDPDGRVVVAGDAGPIGTRSMALARYTSDGSLDDSFGNHGRVTSDVMPMDDDVAFAVARQADGKILVAGAVHKGAADVFSVTRYFPDGTLDSGGFITTDFGNDDKAYTAVAQSDGKIVAVGASGNGVDNDFIVARYETDGTLDSEFGGGTGRVTTSFGGDDVARAVALISGGKIVVAGSFDGGRGFALARYKPDGALDPLFGSNKDGKVATEVGMGEASAEAVAVQSDGKIIVVGAASNGADKDFVVVRYNSNGTVDTRFGGGDGIVTTTFAGGSEDVAYGIDIRSDGKIIVAGSTALGADASDFALAQYLTDGRPDKTFGGGDGLVTLDFFGDEDIASEVVIQSNGRLVVAGSASNNGPPDFAVARFNANGTPDTTFDKDGKDGKVTTDLLQKSPDSAFGVLILSNGRIVAAGCASDQFAVVRYQINGVLDNTFADDGKATTSLPGENACARAVVLGKTNTVILAGYTFNGRDHDFALVRYGG
jgi:uncharacterized delta-60 repeat protein